MGSAYAQMHDPFAPQPTYPTIKFVGPGDTVVGTIVEVGELRQARDYETGEPAFSKKGNPKMQLRLILDVQGDEMALYVPQYSKMWTAIQQARVEAGTTLTTGGTLAVKYVGDVPVDNAPHLKAKDYVAKYTAPAKIDPFLGGESPLTTAAKKAAATPENAPF